MYIYLAQAYTGKEKQAVSEACKFLAQYQNDECKPAYAIYSPIVHWHYVAINHKLPTNSAFWKRENESMLRYCEELWVLLSVPGWQNSKGIRFEIYQCNRRSLAVSRRHFVCGSN